MRRQPLLWLTISIVCFVGALYFYRLGDKWAGPRPRVTPAAEDAQTNRIRLLSLGGNLNAVSKPAPDPMTPTNRSGQLAYRLSNTSAKIGELTRNPNAVLLENALIDTTKPLDFNIPAHLRSTEEPSAYIVQARGPMDNAFRAMLKEADAEIVAYIPNNAYLVTATPGVAASLAGRPGTQSVLPYEPYYKLKASLLQTASQMRDLPDSATLRVLLFPNQVETTLSALTAAGVELLDQTRSPFGTVVNVRPQPGSLPALARIPGVQVIELAQRRVPSSDLSRVVIGIATNSTVPTNYLGLTGTNILVNINDTGVDATHPDLTGRTFFDAAIGGVDTNGHGTHVAGIIASSGGQSATVSNAIGSVGIGGTNVIGQFRGHAAGANLFSLIFTEPDVYLQETAARTNAFISNNSWEYSGAYDYDLASASYDAAVRDALPQEPGSHPLVYVFAAGNSGNGDQGGTSGRADSIVSPATAKNVITVGAIEQPRNVTNEIWRCSTDPSLPPGEVFCETNKAWQGATDSGAQVASFSSRGNVGVSIEGESGRFKPDLVAPGTFVISTRSTQWDTNAYYSSTSYIRAVYQDRLIDPGSIWRDVMFIPENAVEASIRVFASAESPFPFPDLPIYISHTGPPTNSAGGYEFTRENEIVLPRDSSIDPRGDLWYGVGNPTSNSIFVGIETIITVTNDNGNYFEVLQQINEGLSPYYRFESGASMAAAQVSGTLALMQEFFEHRIGRTNSPALMKALLINGARGVGGGLYDFGVDTVLNLQGWGLVNITNTLPASMTNINASAGAPTLMYDQSPTNALASGQSRTLNVTVAPAAIDSPLRVTLVWTDPPGNPAAGIKLVNDLDLIVTNLDNGAVFFGNDIAIGNDFNASWDTNTIPNTDVVNNVENVYLASDLGTNYSITVVGRHVNVNAVSDHPNDVVQDYALVISSGNGVVTNALTMTQSTTVSATVPWVTAITNAFAENPETASQEISGNVLLNQHVGANTPLMGTNQIAAPIANGVITLGMTNQWHFYAITNEFAFTNAAFMTFIPPTLAVPRKGANEFDLENATRIEADIDLYVSPESDLTNLSPTVVASARKALGREGSETIILSNAVNGVYYIGVKAEDQQAAEYALVAVFSLFPFSEEDALGNQYLRGFPVPQVIPDARLNSANEIIPGLARMFAFSTGPDLVRRVILTNWISHELVGDLVGTLTHTREFATVNNHTTNMPADIDLRGFRKYVYDDSGEMDVEDSISSDGPGTLDIFGGKEGAGQWLFTQSDGSVAHVGTNGNFRLFLERQQDLEDGIVVTILPGACRRDFVRVPAEATNLTIEVSIISGSGPVSFEVCPLGETAGCESTTISNSIGGSVTIDIYDNPPLQQGVYSVRTCNLGSESVTVRILARIYRGSIISQTLSNSSGPVALKDDAITYAYITNTSNMRISSLDVSLLFNHPRISDLAITLISPNGTRILLVEDRGGVTTEGMGSYTNNAGEVIYYSTEMVPFYVTDFDTAPMGLYVPGSLFEGWSVLTNSATILPDFTLPWGSNNVLSLGNSIVTHSLPGNNAGQYTLTFLASHAPFLNATVGWWPLDGDGKDIFSGLDGLLIGGGNTTNYTMWQPGKVATAFYGDAVRASVMVPAAPELDVATNGFTVEGWIHPVSRNTNSVAPGTVVLEEGFENAPNNVIIAPATMSGWTVADGSVDVITSAYLGARPHSGQKMLDLNGWVEGTIYRDVNLVTNQPYRLSFAYARNADSMGRGEFPAAEVRLNNQTLASVAPRQINTWPNLQWQTTSFVFTVQAPVARLTFQGTAPGASGVMIDSILLEAAGGPDTAPLVEWADRTTSAPGVQFWLSGLSWTNPQPGTLSAAFPGSNGLSQVLTTLPNAITNDGWQHVAFSFDPALRQARIYANGQLAVSQSVPTDLQPVTTGDLFFGFHPGDATNLASFKGGLDEFGLYGRALTACEVSAIFTAGALGKYGSNVLTCPVAYELTLQGDSTTTYTFTNGLAWTNGPSWEENSVSFTNSVITDVSGGANTNRVKLSIRPLTPNVALDDFVISGVTTNVLSGAMHFTENTNLALLPIKFAPAPYTVSNFPPTLVFSNDFEAAIPGPYTNGEAITGMNHPSGKRDWIVSDAPVTVLSNRFIDTFGTNSLVLGLGTVESTLPTVAGSRYELTYTVRGPGAVGWWNGDIEPLTGRALDLIGGNHGAFVHYATNVDGGFVIQPSAPDTAFNFPAGPFIPTNPFPVVAYSPRIELSDPANLRLTNALTIEGWIYPRNTQTNFDLGVGTYYQQIFYRGDGRDCRDPYYLALHYDESAEKYDILFHVENSTGVNCGFDLVSTNMPVVPDQWQHVAAVFEANIPVPGAPVSTNGQVALTNELRIYLDGELVGQGYTAHAPFADLDPSYTPGASIGNRSRYSRLTDSFTDAEPFHGMIDDIAIYGRALTEPEIVGIYDRNVLGKSDPTALATLRLARVQAKIDGIQVDLANGENAEFTTRKIQFTANRTNTTFALTGLLPGTIIDKITLTERPAELNYLPEEKLSALIGEDSFGVWILEIYDTRAGGTSTNDVVQLLDWELDFRLLPVSPPAVVTLSHGITYTNVLLGNQVQYFVVPVPLWATNATNVLLWATNRWTGAADEVGVLFDASNPAPADVNNALFWPPVTSGLTVLTTNVSTSPYIVPGQSYYLTVTNPSSQVIEFALGVWFDIITLSNCQPVTTVVGPAGIPNYFQFDVPAPDEDQDPREVVFSVSGARSNLTLVVSQYLPLPDLGSYDYISRQPATNDQVVMVLTNTTPYPLTEGRWYAGVFNSQFTNVAYTIQACYSDSLTNAPRIIPLTNNVAFTASATNQFAAPPGPPKWLFFEFDLTNNVSAMLFELYGLNGDADLILQREVPSGMAPYFDGSFRLGKNSEAVVVRLSRELGDLRGKWYAGVYNNESTNLGYTIRVTTPDGTGLLNTALPLLLNFSQAAGPHGITLQWNSIPGEIYIVEFTPTLFPAVWTPFAMAQPIRATTLISAVELPLGSTGRGFYRVRHVPRSTVLIPPMSVSIGADGRIRIAWPSAFTDLVVQATSNLGGGAWFNTNLPIVQEGNESVVYDTTGDAQKFYRLIAL